MTAQPSVDDIMAQIKDNIEEAAPAEEAQAEAPVEEAAADDALELTEEAEAPAEEVVDINAFAESGSTQTADAEQVAGARDEYQDDDADMGDIDVDALLAEVSAETDAGASGPPPITEDGDVDVDAIMAEAAPEAETPELTADAPAAPEEEAVDVDALMAEAAAPEAPVEEAASTEEATDTAEAEGDVDVDALMAEATAADAEVAEKAPAEEPAAEGDVADMVEKVMAPKEAAPVAETAPVLDSSVQALPAIPSAKGLQVGFPVEVLAEALRPLVQEWVQENLPDIVERLVREEIQKLTDQEQLKPKAIAAATAASRIWIFNHKLARFNRVYIGYCCAV